MSEHDEQVALFVWAEWMKTQYPRLRWMYAVPNAAKRSPQLANYMKAEGLKPGVPDVVVPIPTKQYHGLYIEMKFNGNKPSIAQKEWLEYLASVGYATAVCLSFDAARVVIEEYLR
jgi:hypothetical protein